MAFHGRVALVTGAASGMGRLAARRLAALGAQVAAIDVDEDGLAETAEGRPTVRTWEVDVSDCDAVEAVAREVESELGPIDRVVNAAAVMPTGALLEQNVDEVHRVMEVNYGGLVNVTMATLPRMVERKRGDLVQFSSLAGWVPALDFGAYNASKFAVVAFSEVLYHEIRGSGVRMVCVCPPPVDTPLLEQAHSRPRILEQERPLAPERVLEAIETALERGRFWAFGSRRAALAWRLRRFLPGLIWWIDHRTEGR